MATREEKRRMQEQFIEEQGIICLENASMEYPENGAPAIDNVSLHIAKGEFVFVVGDSGSGKSTLIRLLLRELVPTSGNVYVMGQNTKKLRHSQIPKFRRNLGVVFQDFRLLKDRNVYDNVAFAQRIIEVPSREMRRNVPSVLSMVGLAGKYRASVRKLSGGEQQRVALARALVNRPSILLADEPTGNLDPNNTWEIMSLLEEINEQGTTVIVVTHNPEIVNAMKKRVVAMRKGVVISDEEEGTYVNED
jgi:cell division transport system ATP-binding protein